jgi:hypothetical protein
MAKCPNCGRETARTSDWVCQWCGYPLPDGGFKKIQKTYREVKEALQNGEPIEEKPVSKKEIKESRRQEKAPKQSEPKGGVKPQPAPQPEQEEVVQISVEALRKFMQNQAPLAPPAESQPVSQTPPKAETAPKIVPPSPPTPTPLVQPQPAPQTQPLADAIEKKPYPPVSHAQPKIETVQKVVPISPSPVENIPVLPPPQIIEKVTPVSQPPVPAAPEVRPPQSAAQKIDAVKSAPPPPPVESKPAPPPAPKAEPGASAIEITVAELLTAYKTEGPAADARFANQILRVTGLVEKVNVKVAMDIYSVTLNDPGKGLLPQGVRCIFERKYSSALTQLAIGQKVTVQGKYSGSLIDISLRDCSLVS